MIARIVLAGVALAVAFGSGASARTLPAVQMTPSNQPRQCTTPQNLMAFLRSRNRRLTRKFRNIAAEYQRHGRDLSVRWDYAFFQMVVETNSLKFTGDVSASQNNFAGLGATGGGVKGERFRTVSDGVRAQLQHLLIYAGVHVADPVADRTRKVQSWGILDKWRRNYSGPITYSDVGSKWAPADRGYANDIDAIAQAFYKSHCRRSKTVASQSRRRYDSDRRAGLGAKNVRSRQPSAGFRTLNGDKASPKSSSEQRTAAKFAAPAIQPKREKCRVWTASYGGQKATIIRSRGDGTTNYTVLDVNKGREEAESQAYIAAYAKGGSRIGDFPTKAKAMDKAFKLCPKG